MKVTSLGVVLCMLTFGPVVSPADAQEPSAGNAQELSSASVAAPGAAATGSDSERPVVQTDKGLVQGAGDGEVDRFRGIPFAAPPVGALRWAPPAPAARWRDVRDASADGPRCAQLESGNGPRSESEDCLYLNVYRPAGTRKDARLPVLFWIHGGGLRFGSSDQYDGSLLASTNRMVVVSINYRLGVFGFLALPSLGAESSDGASGHYGLLDQQAALRWVRRNIAAFGGDPGRVTLAGQSAGAWAVCANLVSPTARGLFAAAIMQSGTCFSAPLEEAEAAGAAVAEGAGCADQATTAACLRSKPASALLDAGAEYPTRIVPGSRQLPHAPMDAVVAGRFPRVPILSGGNRDEGRTFAQQLGFATLSEPEYGDLVGALFGPDIAPSVLAEYPFAAFPPPYPAGLAIGAVLTDGVDGLCGCPGQNLATTFSRHTHAWFYEFADREAPGLNDDLPGFDWGAGHSLEVAYLWPSFNNGTPLFPQLTPAQLQLSDEMLRYWGAFVRLGAPAVAGQPPWPRHSTGRLLSLRPGGETRTVPDSEYAAEHKCAFWSSLL